MYNRIIVPIDGSDESWRAVRPAATLARRFDAELELVEVVSTAADQSFAVDRLLQRAAEDAIEPEPTTTGLVLDGGVPKVLAEHITSVNGALTVMTSVGRGRTAALVGSVAEGLLQEMFGPIVVVGPHVDPGSVTFEGPLLVTVDGSTTSESSLGLAASLGIALHVTPWVVSVAEPVEAGAGGSDVSDSAYAAHTARKLAAQSHHDVEFESLHGKHPADAIVDYASHVGASMIVASTHGRTGLARLSAGSVAMTVVHRAPCPVVLTRPPHLARPHT